MAYQVTSAAVRVQLGNADLLVEKGRVLPEGVAEADLERLVSKGMIEALPDEPEADKPKHVDDMTVAELKEYAEANGIDLGEASKKNDILAAVKAVQA